jgi:hypothetical protein
MARTSSGRTAMEERNRMLAGASAGNLRRSCPIAAARTCRARSPRPLASSTGCTSEARRRTMAAGLAHSRRAGIAHAQAACLSPGREAILPWPASFLPSRARPGESHSSPATNRRITPGRAGSMYRSERIAQNIGRTKISPNPSPATIQPRSRLRTARAMPARLSASAGHPTAAGSVSRRQKNELDKKTERRVVEEVRVQVKPTRSPVPEPPGFEERRGFLVEVGQAPADMPEAQGERSCGDGGEGAAPGRASICPLHGFHSRKRKASAVNTEAFPPSPNHILYWAVPEMV